LRSVEERYRGSNVRVFRLDREGVLRRLREAAQRILVDRPDVIEIRLIGSLARGDARPGSDADLVVTVNGTGPRSDRDASLMRYLADAGIGCDLIVFTTDELDRLRREGRRIVRAIETEGLVLAQR
jgi:predicted nucleotidyltransferase